MAVEVDTTAAAAWGGGGSDKSEDVCRGNSGGNRPVGSREQEHSMCCSNHCGLWFVVVVDLV